MADAIHIATYYVGNILIEAQEKMPAHSYSNSSYRPSSSRRPPAGGSSYVPSSSYVPGNNFPPPSHNPPQQLQTQQIYIPNELVGCIIGKGGNKINEIRHMSASQIKIMEPGAVGVGMNGVPVPAGGEGERLVVITGQPPNIQMAVQLLYHVSTCQNSFRKADGWPGFCFCSDWNKRKQNFGSQMGLVECLVFLKRKRPEDFSFRFSVLCLISCIIVFLCSQISFPWSLVVLSSFYLLRSTMLFISLIFCKSECHVPSSLRNLILKSVQFFFVLSWHYMPVSALC